MRFTSPLEMAHAKPPRRTLWRLWGLALGVATLIHLLTLDISPIFWQDEVQQVDFGRLTLEPDSEWSTKWSPQTGRPVRVWSYMGPVVHEVFYRVGGQSPRAVRLAALLGALFAATAMLGWLLARGTSAWPAWMLSLAFFLDPLFVKSYKGGRVDGWAIGGALTSCWMLRRATARPAHAPAYAALAGALAALAALAWQSAVFLFPLLLLELFRLARRRSASESGWRSGLPLVAAFFGGGLAVTAVSALPLLPYAGALVEDTRVFLASSAATGASLTAKLRKLLRIGSVISTLNLSVLVLFTAALAALVRREAGMLLATLFGYALIVSTLIYSARVLYLIPFLFALTAGLFDGSARGSRSPFLRRAGIGAVALLLLWTSGLSLIARPGMALKERAERDPTGLFRLAREAIGEGPHEVYLGRTFEWYYAGRPLGWKIYAPNWEPTPPGSPALERRLALFRKVDFVVFRTRDLSENAQDAFLDFGLHYLGTYCTNAPAFSCERGGVPSDYGPYVLYARHP